jgi:hypothetical protein
MLHGHGEVDDTWDCIRGFSLASPVILISLPIVLYSNLQHSCFPQFVREAQSTYHKPSSEASVPLNKNIQFSHPALRSRVQQVILQGDKRTKYNENGIASLRTGPYLPFLVLDPDVMFASSSWH